MTTGDARSLSAEALEVLRRRAVAAVESGVSRSEVARLFGVSRKAVGAWVLAYRRQGETALTPRTRGRRPGEQLALSPMQQARTVKTIIAGTPDTYGLPYRLWTRQAIADLVLREDDLLLSHGTIAHYLVRWGLIDEPRLADMTRRRVAAVVPRQRDTPDLPLRWLPDAETLWLAWTRPHAPAPRPAAPRHNLLSGFRDYYGDVNVLLAMSARGTVFFQAGQGPFDGDGASGFLRRLNEQLGRPLNVIVCRWPARHHDLLPTRSALDADRIALQLTLD
ncbi:helix-turn-helix domain-containing protein [Amycolatopsis cynarae]|uniref:Helix-turn-helix domain-containing protein n=1 Tax=Amycolatopsis cynarae TaxID=2995223 RepID=A0ABY7B3P9_9PSEU|nr:helix-turn-helix domain-containing protein [Amycolatopsis sp. HUAS 11-8]WAL65438.1 helix-turn-helix domain-containing protein [Amycolatopsis sp. HUAS 11-8]